MHWLTALIDDTTERHIHTAWDGIKDRPPVLSRLIRAMRPMRIAPLGPLHSKQQRADLAGLLTRQLWRRPTTPLHTGKLAIDKTTSCEHVITRFRANELHAWTSFITHLQFQLQHVTKMPAAALWRPEALLACSPGHNILPTNWELKLPHGDWHPTQFAITKATPTGYRFVEVFKT